ncbi:hypothetical protein E2C01_094628 [Portunus trituberculatus]|uniref:Uncharacterized protein n=1 Tax=Portunus trituberculatus TaxID=210409 RepID=A0A5B7K1C3_PORTR|nr:hypothetical protein [Portunus trituberculatus]
MSTDSSKIALINSAAIKVTPLRTLPVMPPWKNIQRVAGGLGSPFYSTYQLNISPRLASYLLHLLTLLTDLLSRFNSYFYGHSCDIKEQCVVPSSHHTRGRTYGSPATSDIGLQPRWSLADITLCLPHSDSFAAMLLTLVGKGVIVLDGDIPPSGDPEPCP